MADIEEKTDDLAKDTRRGRPKKVTRELLLDTACDLGFVDLRLIDVADRLNVSIQTLYNHVKDRDELLHLAAEVLEDRDGFVEDNGKDWPDWWRGMARKMKDRYTQYPGLATVLMSRPLKNVPPLSSHWEVAQLVAERFGFEPLDALWANLSVHEFIYSWCARLDRLVEAGLSSKAKIKEKIDPEFIRECPRVSHAARLAMARSADLRFEFQFDALLEGLVTLRHH